MTENIGIAFVSFKDKDNVTDTLQEIDSVKSKLIGKPHYDTLECKNWEIEQASAPTDIIWTELNVGVSRSIPTSIIFNLFLIVLSAVIIFSLIYIDHYAEPDIPDFLKIIFKYMAPLLVALYGLFVLPWMIYKIVQYERHERKSEKEASFMNKNTFMMIMNCLIVPFLVSAILSYYDGNVFNDFVHPKLPKFPKNVLNVTKENLINDEQYYVLNTQNSTPTA